VRLPSPDEAKLLASFLLDVEDKLGKTSQGYVPHTPHPKQRQFVQLDNREALFGGSTGTGKSDALLMAALRDVHLPGYKALILRRTYAEANLPDAIMARAKEWLEGTDAHWNAEAKRFEFPSGAVLQFGYCDNEGHVRRYKGGAYHFVGFEELTEWPEGWYRFLFSRIRRPKGSNIVMRVRANTNPDGPGQKWVQERFALPTATILREPVFSNEGKRVYLPALPEDNPSLDIDDYNESLKELTPVKYQQLRWGMWVRDSVGLVYQYAMDRNAVDEVPKLERHVLAIDYGFKDSTAFVVLGWRKDDPKVYVTRSFKLTGLTPGAAAEQVRELEAVHRFDAIVADIGGLGKGYAEEARQRFHLPIQPADKNNKRGYIEMINGDFAAGRLLIGPGNDDLVKELVELPWDEQRREPHKSYDDHLCDALLYGWRRCRAFYESEPVPAPALGTREALLAKASADKQAHLAALKKKAETAFWRKR
jgi:hypothetical protein